MKFAKRLASEASRRGSFSAGYFDYRAAKKAIKEDISKSDVAGSNFQKLLETELHKVSRFYSVKADGIEATLRELHGGNGTGSVQQLTELRSEIRELIKFVALNYLAVVKAIKKRNRHLKESFGGAASISLQALDMLGHEVFFTSPRLAGLATQADVLVSGLASSGSSPPAAVLEEYQCPICLDTLHNPAVLTCAHRFCWGCLVAAVAAVRHQQQPLGAQGAQADRKDCGIPGISSGGGYTCSLQLLERIAAQADSEEQQRPQQQRFYNCPVCRQPQLLDIDSLSVDPFLTSFIESLKLLSVSTVAAAAAANTASGNVATPQPPSSSSSPSRPAAQAAVVSELTLQLQQQQQQQPQQQPPPPQSQSQPTTPCASQLQPLAAPHPEPQPQPTQPQPQSTWGLLPPQRPEHAGRLCVLLDLDGTLASSYTPRRAPRLPPYVRTHVVGRGSQLNPAGVFVVERPGLTEFLEELAAFAEVVIFTAGLEDYASPIIDALDPSGRLFAHRIYRQGTLRTPHYQCVKDMCRLGRPLCRTVLVDDTPLAFLHQPDNGVPVLGFRGDPDDRLLMEAVLPLMQVLSREADVRHVLQRRFDMTTWFRRNAFPIDDIIQQAAEAAAREQQEHEQQQHQLQQQLSSLGTTAACTTTSPPTGTGSPSSQPAPANTPYPAATPASTSAAAGAAAAAGGSPSDTGDAAAALYRRYAFTSRRLAAPTKRFCLLTDFDKTLTDVDAGEAVVEQLAPELLPMLMGLASNQSYIPITNTILSEMQRRGVSRDVLLTTLQQLGAEMPLGSVELLRMMAGAGVDVRILSDCNSVFIAHILAGAKASSYVTEIITNPASFERVGVVSQGGEEAGAAAALQRAAGHRLVIRPHFTGLDPTVLIPPAATAAAAATTAGTASGTCQGSSGSSSSSGGCCTSHKTPAGGDAAAASSCKEACCPGHCSGGAAAAAANRCCQEDEEEVSLRECAPSSHDTANTPPPPPQGHHLHLHRQEGCPTHGCPRCPDNMCKGLEVQRLQHTNTYTHIVYCGDGSNDICAALALGAQDVVLARAGLALARYIEEAQVDPALPQVAAQVAFWSTHEELLACVRQVVDV